MRDERKYIIMPKLKTHSASKKRFRVTANGKVKMTHAFRRHRLVSKTRKSKKASNKLIVRRRNGKALG